LVSNKLFFVDLNLNLNFSIICIYIFSYIYIIFSFLILLFLTFTLKKNSLYFSKLYCWNAYTRIFAIVIFLSLAGVPPFIGFFSKFFFFFFLFIYTNYLVILNFIFINFLIFYFYIQYLRYLYYSNNSKIFTLRTYAIPYSVTCIAILLFFFNVMSFVFIDYICIWMFFIHSFF
jgi:NADH:ubiquinone oxidoreductase subunit 2 (subunit N)